MAHLTTPDDIITSGTGIAFILLPLVQQSGFLVSNFDYDRGLAQYFQQKLQAIFEIVSKYIRPNEEVKSEDGLESKIQSDGDGDITKNINDQIVTINSMIEQFNSQVQTNIKEIDSSISTASEVLAGPVSYTHLTLPTNREV